MYEEMTESDTKRPTSWTFPGWITFIAFTKSVASGSQNPHHLLIIFGKEDPEKNEEKLEGKLHGMTRRNKRVKTP
jgi:hypothetical protein